MDHNHRDNDRRMTETFMNKIELVSASNDDAPTTLNEKLDKIIKIIHARIEEKYRDFRQAFRAIDLDFGGYLDFKEFMSSLETLGIKLRLNDFKLIFDALDYDSKGTIDFSKFTYLNSDRFSVNDLLKRVISQLNRLFNIEKRLHCISRSIFQETSATSSLRHG